MKRFYIAIIAIISALGCLYAEKSDYSLKVEDFSELNVTDAINVEYRCSADTAGWAFFSCEPAIASKLMFSNTKDRLRIQLSSDGEKIDDLPTIVVYSSTLTKLENAGDSTVTARKLAAVPSLKIKVIGNGTIIAHGVQANSVDAGIHTGCGHLVISGNATKAKLQNVGTGPLEAGGLNAEQAKCVVLGTGPIDCSVSDKLTIVGAGTGKIYYNGKPEITNRSLGIKAYSVSENE
jgi:hypothetical protein